MSIDATVLQYELRRKLNEINSDFSKTIGVADADALLNEAKDRVFENYAVLYETNTTIRNHLRELEEKKVCLACAYIDDRCCKITYPEDFYMLLSQSAIANKKDCKDRRLTTRIVQSNEIERAFKDAYRSPSWSWGETIADDGKDGLFVYTQQEGARECDNFLVKEVCVDYLRKPRDISTPSLTKNGKYQNSKGEEVTQDVALEFSDTFLWRKIVDVAVLLFKVNIGEVNEYQTQLDQIIRVDRLYTN